jgi:ribonuclease BN (tRNA processing enzyme)
MARPLAVYVPEGCGLEMLRVLDAALARRGGIGRSTPGLDISEYGPRSRIRVGDLQLSFAPTGHRLTPPAIRVSDGQAVLALGASGVTEQSVEHLAGDADLLVLEVTAKRDRHGRDDGVMTATQAGKIASRRSSKRLLLNPRQPSLGDELHKLARRAFAGPIDLAHEGIVYDLA